MKCIIGLGNPGAKYANTRHNLGFTVIHQVAERLNIQVSKQKYHALYGEGMMKGEKIILLQPLTFMNLSGKSVCSVVNYLNLPLEDLLVIYDDMDFSVGQLRLRKKGSAGGHNGMRSVIAALQTNAFARLRIGIGKPSEREVISHVLSTFSKDEQIIMDQVIEQAVSAVLSFITQGIDQTMNHFNIDILNP